MTLAETLDKLDQINEAWRSETSAEQKMHLADLDDLLEQLDEMEPKTAAEAARVDELRGRIEIMMDEIEISLGIEPPVISRADLGEPDEEI